jgi:o-succinylbenzoate synthase
MNIEFERYLLKFSFDAGTSRGIMKTRPILLLKLSQGDYQGIGEVAPIDGLSLESIDETEHWLADALKNGLGKEFGEPVGSRAWLEEYLPERYRALRMGFEMAYAHLHNRGNYWFDGSFINGKTIPINGLVWMSDLEQMLSEAKKKWEQGYDCIKIKVGAIDFDSELALLHEMRKWAGPGNLIIRVDANGAFDSTDVFDKLKALQRYKLHSIEQPIKPGQWDLMEELCLDPIVPIALDEELIHSGEPDLMIRRLKPAYIVLKPSLIGGFTKTERWIKAAESKNIQWWLTSALESNYGLQALAQFVSRYNLRLHQGLGTGQLFENNIGPDSFAAAGQLSFTSRLP